MRTVLAALVAALALVATAAGDETQSCSAGARADDGAGATAVRAELDAMEHALAQAKSSLRALETLVETQSARLETMRALVATPGVTCDGSVAAAERLADAMLATRAERRDRSLSVEDLHDPHHHRDARLPAYRDVGRTSSRRISERDVSSDTLVAYRRVPYDDVERVDRPAVARRLDAWTDHLTLTGAVRLERGASATAMVTLPQRDHERDDFPRYFAVGDSSGGVRVLRADGDVAVTLPPVALESEADSESSSETDSESKNESRRSSFAQKGISSLAASYQRKNETIVVAGDANGGVAFYQVFETTNDEEYPRTLAGTVFASYAKLRSISPKDARGTPVPAKAAHWEKERDRLAKARRRRLASVRDDSETRLGNAYDLEASESAIAATVGAAHPQGVRYVERDDATFRGVDANDSKNRITAVAAYRLNDGKRYFAVADASGALVVFADRGASVHSVYRVDDDGENDVDHVVAFKPSRRAISFVTRTGVGSLDPATFVLRKAPCAGTDDGRTRFASVAFDAAQSSKFYAVTDSGETVAGAVGGVDVGTGAGVRATCARRHRDVTGSQSRSTPGEGPGPPLVPPVSASLASVKGYAFAALGARVAVLNVTDAKRSISPSGGAGSSGVSRAPREVVVADVTSLASAFGGSSLVAAHATNGEDIDDEDIDDEDLAEIVADARVGGFEKTKKSVFFPSPSAIVATDARGSFVAVALPGGFIAMYESALYVWKPEPLNTKLWSQPLYVAAMGAVAVFQFYRSKNGAGRRFAGGGFSDPGGFGADADALRQFDRMTRTSRGFSFSADSSFDPAAFRRQMERDGRWKRTTKAE